MSSTSSSGPGWTIVSSSSMMIPTSPILSVSTREAAIKFKVVFLGTRWPGFKAEFERLIELVVIPWTPVFKLELAEAGETDPLEGTELP